jgi:hypothetical protein
MIGKLQYGCPCQGSTRQDTKKIAARGVRFVRVRAMVRLPERVIMEMCVVIHSGTPSRGISSSLAGAERSSALQRAILALAMPTRKRHFAPGRLQLLISRTFCRAKLFESDRLA